MHQLRFLICLLAVSWSSAQLQRQLGRLQEVFAWKQLTFDVDGVIVNQDRDDPVGGRSKRQADDDEEEVWSWGQPSNIERPASSTTRRPNNPNFGGNTGRIPPTRPTARPTSSTGDSDEGRFFIQYNNVPMGVERVGNRVFVTIPRRRYGIPSTLNYIDYSDSSNVRSPPLKPYPNIRDAAELTSVYRTRADSCGRLWMVDTGRLELRGTQRQLRTPAIVLYDLNTDRQILRHEFKSSDLPAENTPTGLASITVDITNNDCANAYAYVPDLTTFGLIVFSLQERDTWRHQHNYFSFNPVAGNLFIATRYAYVPDFTAFGLIVFSLQERDTWRYFSLNPVAGNLFIANQRFQWSDGIFSVTLVPSGSGKTAYFHSLIGTHEFSVSTNVLKNKTAIQDPNYFSMFSVLGDRGEMSQSTMHDYHPGTNVIFWAEIGRDAVTCWNAGEVLRSTNVAVLARDSRRLSYPSDLHVTGDEVWLMANTLPQFGYSRYDTNEYNFYVYKARVQDVIAGTVCAQYNSV